jgi:hypothetical protein
MKNTLLAIMLGCSISACGSDAGYSSYTTSELEIAKKIINNFCLTNDLSYMTPTFVRKLITVAKQSMAETDELRDATFEQAITYCTGVYYDLLFEHKARK